MNRLLYVGGAVALTAAMTAAFWYFDVGASNVPAPVVRPIVAPATAVASAAAPSVAVDAAPADVAASTPGELVTGGTDAPITVSAPSIVQVGSPYEVVVSLGENTGVSEIAFTARFDPNVLRASAGAKGDWGSGPGLDDRFEAEVPATGDHARIRSTVTGRRAGGGGGRVASVQFDAIAHGTTSVTIDDLVARDLAGRPIPSVARTTTIRMTVE